MSALSHTNACTVAAVGCLVAAAGLNWALGSLFHAMAGTPGATVIAVTTAAVAAATCLAALWLLLARLARDTRPAAVVLVFCAVLWVLRTASLVLPQYKPTGPQWLAVAGGVALLAALAGQRVPAALHVRLCGAVCVGALAFTASGLVRPWISTQPPATVFSLAWLDPQARRLPTVVVLFDEFSPEFAGSFTDVLREHGLPIAQAAIDGAGANTINSVPAMLTGKDFSAVAYCGLGTVCGGDGPASFGKLRAVADVDVLGFHLPYCSITGLRTCESLGVGWLNGSWADDWLCGRFPRLERCVEARRSTRAYWMSLYEQRLNEVPFWRSGGVLYLHLPLPHPPAQPSSYDLREDYKANLVEMSRISRHLVSRALRAFGPSFTLVFTSDHPLRVSVHCSLPYYRAPGCSEGLPSNIGKVPLVVTSPNAQAVVLPRSARGLLK